MQKEAAFLEERRETGPPPSKTSVHAASFGEPASAGATLAVAEGVERRTEGALSFRALG
jgi:hypothetical protein